MPKTTSGAPGGISGDFDFHTLPQEKNMSSNIGYFYICSLEALLSVLETPCNFGNLPNQSSGTATGHVLGEWRLSRLGNKNTYL